MKKKPELSFMNAFFCILVVLIHILSSPVTQLDKQSIQYAIVFLIWRLSAFVVQGFIFLSGVKMALGFTKPIKYIKYVKSRFFGVVIPYIIWVFAFYIYFVLRNYFDFSLIDLAGYMIRGDLVSHFYFVIIIVQFYLLRPVWKLMTEKIKFLVALLVTISIMILSKLFLPALFGGYTDRIFTTYLIFWICGCYMGTNYEYIKKKIVNHKEIIAVVFLGAAISEGVLGYMHFIGEKIAYIEVIHLFYCICAVMFCTAFSFRLGKWIMHNRFLKEIDGASFYIYLVHPLFIFMIDEKMQELGITSISNAFLVRAAVVYTASILSCIAYEKIKRKVNKCWILKG